MLSFEYAEEEVTVCVQKNWTNILPSFGKPKVLIKTETVAMLLTIQQ